MLGVGGLQNVNDVLFLKNIDMGVVDEDNLRLLKKKDPVLYANVEQRIQYITKLYNSEFQVLARSDIKSYDDLRGKKVNFNLKDSQTEVTADTVFNALGIQTQRSYYDNDEAMKRLIAGDISAMIILTGAPQVTMSKVKKEDGVHFLPLDQASLPNHDLKDLFASYLPADLDPRTLSEPDPRRDDGSDHRQPGAARRLYLAGELAPLQENRQVRRCVLQQDRSVQQLVAAPEVARSQPCGRHARLGAVQAGRRLAGCPPQPGDVRQSGYARPVLSRIEAGLRQVHAEVRRFIRSEVALQRGPAGAVHQVHEVPRRAESGAGRGSLNSRKLHDTGLGAQRPGRRNPAQRHAVLAGWTIGPGRDDGGEAERTAAPPFWFIQLPLTSCSHSSRGDGVDIFPCSSSATRFEAAVMAPAAAL